MIFVTARIDPDNETRGIEAGAVGFIHKPINPQVLTSSPAINGGDSLYRTIMPDRISLRRLIQQNAYLSDSHRERRITGNFCTQYRLPNGKKIQHLHCTGGDCNSRGLARPRHERRGLRSQWVNPYFTQLTGYSFDEVRGKNPSILQSGLTNQTVYRDLWTQLAKGHIWVGEIINRTKHGQTYVEETHIAPVVGADGQRSHYVAIKLDITERKQSQKTRPFGPLRHPDQSAQPQPVHGSRRARAGTGQTL